MQLITGGLGFVGQHTARALLDRGESSVVVTQSGATRVSTLLRGEIDQSIFVEHLSVKDRPALLALGEKYPITGIIHLSGATSSSQLTNIESNLQELLNVFAAAEAWGVRRVCVASTIGVYAGLPPDSDVLSEDAALPLRATGPMPTFKKAVELLSDLGGAAGNFQAVKLRFAAWGPLFHHPPSPANVIGQMVRAAVEQRSFDGRQPQAQAFAEDGLDTSYVKDCARALAGVQLAEQLSRSTYNIGAGQAFTNQEFAEALNRVIPTFRWDLPEGFNPHGPGRRLNLDVTRIRADIGYRPHFTLDAAVDDYVRWLQQGQAF